MSGHRMTVAPELSKPLERRSRLTYHMLSPPVLRRACMHRHSHPLPAPSLGVQRDVVSLHFGVPGAGPRCICKPACTPTNCRACWCCTIWRKALAAAEQADELIGEVIVVPVANPIGLGQSVLREPVGRFALHSGDNFNRGYPPSWPSQCAPGWPGNGAMTAPTISPWCAPPCASTWPSCARTPSASWTCCGSPC